MVLRKAYGAGYYVMCGRAYEPDLLVAWPSAEISVMGAEGAVEIIFRKQVQEAEDPAAKRRELIESFREIIDVYIAAGNDMIDDVIDPRETRQTICRALELAAGQARRAAVEAKRRGAGMRLSIRVGQAVVVPLAIAACGSSTSHHDRHDHRDDRARERERATVQGREWSADVQRARDGDPLPVPRGIARGGTRPERSDGREQRHGPRTRPSHSASTTC